jgi:hypothetical protein
VRPGEAAARGIRARTIRPTTPAPARKAAGTVRTTNHALLDHGLCTASTCICAAAVPRSQRAGKATMGERRTGGSRRVAEDAEEAGAARAGPTTELTAECVEPSPAVGGCEW